MQEVTPALQALESSNLGFEVVRTERARSVEESADLQGIHVGDLLKTIVVRRAENDHFFVLVPGDRAIDWTKLRKHVGVSRLSLPDADEAKAATGYERGAITPFGARTPLAVIADATVATKEKVAIGGGGHGVNLHMQAKDLIAELGAEVADVTKPA